MTAPGGAAGRPSMLTREPASFAAACDCGMTSFPRPPRGRPRTRQGDGASKRRVRKCAPLTRAAIVWEVPLAGRGRWVSFPGASAGARAAVDVAAVELQGGGGAPTAVEWCEPDGLRRLGGDYTVTLRAKPQQHSDVKNVERKFSVALGLKSTGEGLEFYTVGVDLNDAVYTLERRCAEGQTRTRLLTVPDGALASRGGGVEMQLRIRGGSAVRLLVDGVIVLKYDVGGRGSGGVGLLVDDAKCLFEDWRCVDHQAVALAAAADALAMASSASAAAAHSAAVAWHARSTQREADDSDLRSELLSQATSSDFSLPGGLAVDGLAVEGWHRRQQVALLDVGATTRRCSQRSDIGLACLGCARPFTKLGEPMVVQAAIAARFHDAGPADQLSPCVALYFDRCGDAAPATLPARCALLRDGAPPKETRSRLDSVSRGASRGNGVYADGWLRARLDGLEAQGRGGSALGTPRLRSVRWQGEAPPGELVRAGAAAIELPDGTKQLAGPLPKRCLQRLAERHFVETDENALCDDERAPRVCPAISTATRDGARASTPSPSKRRPLPSVASPGVPECPICMNPLFQRPTTLEAAQPRVLRLPCSRHHVFHERCLLPWFAKCSLCPTCRADVRPLLGARMSKTQRGLRQSGSGTAMPEPPPDVARRPNSTHHPPRRNTNR
ncbi:hypothetical protein M885DRAFT_512021 [Pelagophyceae sp. CCMP2097]|nr:hypothetical protein M885DRAFT_512021 [Pelagophyceae sp. CCMP2097]